MPVYHVHDSTVKDTALNSPDKPTDLYMKKQLNFDLVDSIDAEPVRIPESKITNGI